RDRLRPQGGGRTRSPRRRRRRDRAGAARHRRGRRPRPPHRQRARMGKALPMSRARSCTLALLLAASTFTPAAVSAESAPESMLAERMAAGKWNRYRVVTARSTFEFSALRTDSIGVLLQAAPRRPAIVSTPDARPDPARYVRWAEIEHVDASRTHAGKGAFE